MSFCSILQQPALLFEKRTFWINLQVITFGANFAILAILAEFCSNLIIFVRDGILSVADYNSTRVGVVVVVVVIVVVVYFFTMG